MTKEEAFTHLNNGRKIRVNNWADDWFIEKLFDGRIICEDNTETYHQFDEFWDKETANGLFHWELFYEFEWWLIDNRFVRYSDTKNIDPESENTPSFVKTISLPEKYKTHFLDRIEIQIFIVCFADNPTLKKLKILVNDIKILDSCHIPKNAEAANIIFSHLNLI